MPEMSVYSSRFGRVFDVWEGAAVGWLQATGKQEHQAYKPDACLTVPERAE
jgi:hypothetical protein